MQFFTMLQMMFSAITKPKVQIILQEIPKGRVIDIGGGGEGVIARAGKAGVVSVDQYLSEIYEARGKAPEAGWVAADAAVLPCTPRSFDHATAFLSCMYMSAAVKEKVFRETYRVLKPGGELWIWDVPMSCKSKLFAVRVHVTLHDHQTIDTIYGVKAKDQSPNGFCTLLQEIGFVTEVITNQQHWFLIKAKKTSF